MEDWWTVEHSAVVVFMVSSVAAVLRRGRGNLAGHLSQICVLVQIMTSVGCFAWLAAGHRYGVVFNEKLFYPSLALLSMAFQVSRAIMYLSEKEMFGYADENSDIDGKSSAGVFKNVGRLVCIAATICFLAAVFGPPREGHHLSFVVLFPVVGAIRLVIVLTKSEDAASSEESSETEASEPETEDAAERPEQKGEVSIWQRTVNAIWSVARTALQASLGGWTLIVSLPWSRIVETVAAFGASAALTYAYWTLTEDHLTWLSSFFALFVPIVAGKAEAKKLLSGSTALLIIQGCQVTMAVSQYHLFRSYILL